MNFDLKSNNIALKCPTSNEREPSRAKIADTQQTGSLP
jgi:hypothetical protein